LREVLKQQSESLNSETAEN